MTGLLKGPGDWWLAPEGAAVHGAERAAVVADVHLGYEFARGKTGDFVPTHSLADTVRRLRSLLARVDVTRLIVAGDLVESRKFCRDTESDLARLRAWLRGKGVELIALAGNHDPPRRPALAVSCDVDGWTIAHGHKAIKPGRAIFGHYHPTLRAQGLSAPCFLIDESTIVLPAFSSNAAGVSLTGLDRSLTTERPSGPLRCVASSGDTLLDFGPVPALLRALA
jgi:uncharacterized protein